MNYMEQMDRNVNYLMNEFLLFTTLSWYNNNLWEKWCQLPGGGLLGVCDDVICITSVFPQIFKGGLTGAGVDVPAKMEKAGA